MHENITRRVLLGSALAAGASWAGIAGAQAPWPTRPVKILISCTPVMACYWQGASPCRSWSQLRS